MCGTPVQAIWDHKDLTELAGGVREAVQRPPNWSMTPEMDPKCFLQLPLIDSSPFPDLVKHYSLYIYIKNTLIIFYGQKCCFLIFQLCALTVAN